MRHKKIEKQNTAVTLTSRAGRATAAADGRAAALAGGRGGVEYDEGCARDGTAAPKPQRAASVPL